MMRHSSVLLNSSLILCISLLAQQVSHTRSNRVPPREPQLEQRSQRPNFQQQQQEEERQQQQQQQSKQQQQRRQDSKSPAAYLTSVDESHEPLMRTAAQDEQRQQQQRQINYQRQGNRQQASVAAAEMTLRVQQHQQEQRQQQEQPQVDRLAQLGATAPTAARVALRVDKRSWSPRASRTQETKEDEAVSLLLEEVASLDIDTATGTATGGQDQTMATQAVQAPVSDEANDRLSSGSSSSSSSSNSGGRLRGLSSLVMNGSTGNQNGHGGGSQSVVNGSRPGVNVPPYRVGTLGADSLKRNNHNRHLPCYFNAIACF